MGDKGRDVSAKDLVSSIISAANKKIRKKDKYRSTDSVEVDADSEVSYNERNIDREIELRRIKELTPQLPSLQKEESSSSLEVSITSSVKTSSSTAVTLRTQTQPTGTESRDTGLFNAKMVFLHRKDSEPTMALPTPNIDLQVTRYPALVQPELTSYATENAKPTLLRRYSEDILTERKGGEHDEVNHQPHGRTTHFTRRAQLHLASLDKGKQELRQKEEERRQTQQQLASDRKRIELELQRTREEMEREDTMDDTVLQLAAAAKVKVNDPDSRSVTSDYSTMSSTGYPGANNVHISHSSSSLLTNSAAEVSRRRVDPRRRKLQRAEASHPHDDLDLCTLRPVPFDPGRVVGRGTIDRRKARGTPAGLAERGEQTDYSRQRRGSLDSLRDFYQHGGGDYTVAPSTHSEDSEDLVDSLTSTFDKKMKFLNDMPGPKSWEQAAPRGSIKRTEQVGDSLYRDPSLHRSPSQDPKVGIASRFERKDDRQVSKVISKSEKTDANLCKQRDTESSVAEYADELRKSTERLFGSRERLIELSLPKQAVVPPKHKARKCKHRRHTVGGTNDLEHFKALMEVMQNCKGAAAINRLSAWERLQPSVPPDTQLDVNRDVHMWIQQQNRLRHAGSSPALLDPTLQLLPQQSQSVVPDTVDRGHSWHRSWLPPVADPSPLSTPTSPSPNTTGPLGGSTRSAPPIQLGSATFTFESSI